MKDVSGIWDSWDNGMYVGSLRSHGRVTVEPDWELRMTDKSYGDSKRGPFRWYQDSANSQVEIEVPNVKSISIDRSIDTDIASCTITMFNQWMNTNGEEPDLPGQLGTPGYFSWGHGSHPEAQARWNQSVNSWEDVLLPNALIRTYQGFGGFDDNGLPLDIDVAVAAGNITLTGVWLVDDVALSVSGEITLRCRDVGKLLAVQQYFPPLVPSDVYMNEWCRWVYENVDVGFNPRKPRVSFVAGDFAPRYYDSSADHWYGPTSDVHGHLGPHSVDGNPDTFALSVGNYHPSRHFCCLGGDTKVATLEHGLVPISSIAGLEATIVSQNGNATRWRKAPFESFGKKKVSKILLSRFGVTKEIVATPDHKWYLKDGTIVRTDALSSGQYLKTINPPAAIQRGGCIPSKLGIAAGLVYGDGSNTWRKSGRKYRSSGIQLYQDSMQFASMFEELGATATLCTLRARESVMSNGQIVKTNEQMYVDIQGLPGYFKDVPDLSESTSYLYGWLAGYFAADGHVSKKGEIIIRSKSISSIEAVYAVCLRLGIATSEILCNNEVYSIAFVGSTVPREFFLLQKHLDNLPTDRRNGSPTSWKVVEVCALQEEQEVFCATVENEHNFMIEGNILTHNCDWFEYEINGIVNEIYVKPWAGNYDMYISVLEGGVWQTNNEGNIFYSIDDLVGTQPIVVDTGAAIPYVMKTGVPWEEGAWYKLPRAFLAQRIRISFRNHTLSEWGPLLYRCGIREVKVRMATFVESPPSDPWTFSMAAYSNPASLIESGYWVVDDVGEVFAFGDARLYDIQPGHRLPQGGEVFPFVSICPTATGLGYWILQTNGYVYPFGDAEDYGDGTFSAFVTNRADFIDMARTPTGAGYWLLRRDGEVVPCGDAVHYGDAVPSGLIDDEASFTGMSIESHPSLDGYWVLDGNGQVQAFGSLPDYGGISPFRDGLKEHEFCRCLRRNSAGDGYWILGGSGRVYNFGAAQDHGQVIYPDEIGVDTSNYEVFRRLTWGLAPTPSDGGYWVVQAHGAVWGQGDALLFGSPGGFGQIRKNGNYRDYADIVKFLLAWAGFLWYVDGYAGDPSDLVYDPSYDSQSIDVPPVYGNIEATGVFADDCISLDVFDKKPIIDGINTIKEIVGYVFFIDDEGAARFESPNWWSIGNFYQDGTPTDFVPEIDERTVLTDYTVQYSDDTARSEIIISTEDPTKGNESTLTTRFVPATSSVLRGIVKPAMWLNGVFKDAHEQRIMAELIAMHIWFQQRTGSVTCLANPCIQINDQVRIYERVTSETFVHYVRGISSQHDLESGEYMMTLTTHWLGDESDWVITRDNIPSGAYSSGRLQMSDELLDWLQNVTSRAVQVARLNDFGQDVDNALYNYDEPPDEGGTGGAAGG